MVGISPLRAGPKSPPGPHPLQTQAVLSLQLYLPRELRSCWENLPGALITACVASPKWLFVNEQSGLMRLPHRCLLSSPTTEGRGRGRDKAQPPSSSQAPRATGELAHRDHHDATPLTPKPFLSLDQELSFLWGFFWGGGLRTHQEHQPQRRGAAGRRVPGAGASLGAMLIFSLGHVAGGGGGCLPCGSAAGVHPFT